MERDTVLQEFNKIFKDVFDNPDLEINASTTSRDVEDWDSLNHIQLVVAIEKRFGVKFTTEEVSSYNNVGAMCEAVLKKLKK
jgi:acyl carrier protein